MLPRLPMGDACPQLRELRLVDDEGRVALTLAEAGLLTSLTRLELDDR